VAEVNPNLVARNSQGKAESVHYDQVDAMLLNEFLKEHRRVQEQQKEIDALKAEVKEQRDLIHRVSAKVDTMAPLGLVTKNP
jgi:Skp family chaperone for outer membrane proteins